MPSRKRVLLSTTVVPLVVFAGVAATGLALSDRLAPAPAQAQCAPKKVNPCAAAKPNPCAAQRTACAASKACSPCNPCAAAKACSPCNPCAAAACGACSPCNPCAAACGACSPCSPCAAAGGAVSRECVVPRLQTAAKCNPCAAAKPCSPCNPCAAAACSACSPCNPCAAAKPCSPCNPCAAAACGACSPCNPCNPCAAAACSPCAPCSPCGAGEAVELTDAEATEVYDCLMKELKAAYAKSDHEVALSYMSWPRYSQRAYVSATHGNRYVQNYANDKGRAYGAYEQAGTMPSGAALAKDSFTVTPDGKVMVGPLFVMEKMEAGFNPDSDDWRYTMIMPDGSIFGVTKGRESDKVEFCIGCHKAVSESDSLLFMPEAYRVQ